MAEPSALLSYLFVMSITPGPNNLMLTASGVNFGVRRSLPHMLGICFGNALQLLSAAALMASIAAWIGELRWMMAALGCTYLLWLAYKIGQAGAPERRELARPMGFWGAALFQAVNPKAWVMVLNTAILFMPREGQTMAALGLAIVSAGVALPCVAAWAWGGERLRTLLQHPAALRAFNLTMAATLAATAIWLLVDEYHIRFGAA